MSPVHLAFVAVIALIFLGPKKLPELARSIGSGMREFRESMSIDSEDKAPVADIAPPVATEAPAAKPAAMTAAEATAPPAAEAPASPAAPAAETPR